MGGYIGSKAVSLSTTSADVTGNADIGGDLTVDTNTLHVDSTNNRVGVGTGSPSAKLHVASGGSPSDLELKFDTGSGSTSSNFVDFNHSRSAGNFTFSFAGSEAMRITSEGRIGIGTTAPDEIMHIVASGTNSAKIELENASQPRGNYIGMVDSDNIEIAADEDNTGTDSTIRFRVDADEKMRLESSQGALLINKTSVNQPTNAPTVLLQSHSTGGSAMMVGRNDATVNVGDNVGAYLFRSIDSSGVKYGGMVSRGRNTTGDAYLGFYSVDSRLQAGSEPDHVMLENMDFYSRAGSHYVGYNVLGASYSTSEDGFFAYNNGSGTGDSRTFLRVRDGTGADYVYQHTRRGTIKSEIEEDGSFHSAPNSYGGTSDERLKENIVTSGSQWDDIKAVQVKKYSWIEDGLDAPNQLGVIAQDLMASGMNGLVQQHFKTEMNPETKEDEPVLDADGNQEEFYTVKYSILYMKAIKALQEAMERIETLETEQTAIKARLDALEAN